MSYCLYFQVCGIINNMNITTWLRHATKQLKDIGIDSARLDAELILAETIRKNRTYLHAHLNEELDPRRIDIADARLSLRLDRVPLAYIVGYKEFYGRKFAVSPAVLVPRPESEDMITLLLEASAELMTGPKTLIDVGTGSGCLGITAKLQLPELSVTLSDVSPNALAIAQKNADQLGANVAIKEQSLLTGHIEPLQFILANLPYVDQTWQTSPETRHEPSLALFAKDGGLALIKNLIEQAPRHLLPSGSLIVEADPSQHQAIIEHAKNYNLEHQKTLGYCLSLRLISAER